MKGETAFWQIVLQKGDPGTAASRSAGYAVAAADGLAGLFYRRAVEHDLPLEDSAHAAAAYRQTAERNLRLQIRLGHLLEAGAEFVLLPGAGLMPLYPDLGCRWMEDVDLLVPPRGRARLEEALRAVGAEPLPRHGDLWVVERPEGRAVFDLHADLGNCERVRARRWAGWLDPGRAWQERQDQPWDGLCLQVLCPEDALLYSAAHAVRHGFRRLAWILDVGLLLPKTDWQRLHRRAEDAGLQRPLRYCLDIWRNNGGRVEEPAVRWLEGASWKRGEKAVYAGALAERGGRLWGDALLAGNIPGRWRRWVFWAETCFPRPAVLLQVYPSLPRRLAALGYVLRAGHLVWDAVALAGRLGKRFLAVKRGGNVE